MLELAEREDERARSRSPHPPRSGHAAQEKAVKAPPTVCGSAERIDHMRYSTVLKSACQGRTTRIVCAVRPSLRRRNAIIHATPNQRLLLAGIQLDAIEVE